MGMIKAWKYRLYPSKIQIQSLNSQLYECKRLWNSLLEYAKSHYEQTKTFPNKTELCKQITQFTIFSQIAQNVADRLCKSLGLMIAKKKLGKNAGFPRFKSFDRMKSFTYPQFGFRLDSENRKLILSKIGSINIRKHREMQGTIKTLTIKKMLSGKWFAIFTTEYEAEPVMNHAGLQIGLDLGIEHFAYLSNGEAIPNPRHLKKAEEKLAQAQRRMSKKKKGSKNRQKAKLALARVYENLVNKRTDFLHKISKELSETYSLIALEKLNVRNMARKENHLAKSIHDCSWAEFVNMLKYKAEEAGSEVIFANPANTTQQCSNCGLIRKKTLANRWHNCACGLSMHRDHNAAMNILNRATPGTGGSKACGEETNTHYNAVEQVSSMKQEAKGFSPW